MGGYVGKERERKFLTCLNLGLKLCQAQGISKLILNLLKCLTFDLFSPNNFSNNNKNIVKHGDFPSHVGCRGFLGFTQLRSVQEEWRAGCWVVKLGCTLNLLEANSGQRAGMMAWKFVSIHSWWTRKAGLKELSFYFTQWRKKRIILPNLLFRQWIDWNRWSLL